MIGSKYFLINVVLLMIGTISIRGSFISLSGKMNISDKVRQLFTYIPAAIFPALIVPVTFYHQGESQFLFGKERCAVMLAMICISWFMRNTLAIIALGLVALYFVSKL